jgi:hypothetical protein
VGLMAFFIYGFGSRKDIFRCRACCLHTLMINNNLSSSHLQIVEGGYLARVLMYGL